MTCCFHQQRLFAAQHVGERSKKFLTGRRQRRQIRLEERARRQNQDQCSLHLRNFDGIPRDRGAQPPSERVEVRRCRLLRQRNHARPYQLFHFFRTHLRGADNTMRDRQRRGHRHHRSGGARM
jgi:hypothetical protein